MVWTLVSRVTLGAVTLLVASALIFTATEVLPGDVATAILGQTATPEALEAIRKSLGLNDPPIVRYWLWLSDFLQGELGTSLTNGLPVADELGRRLVNTLFLAGVAALVALPLALLLGIIAAIKQNSLIDKAINIVSLTAISLPEFFLAYLLIVVAAVHLNWFPSLSMVHSTTSLGERLYLVALPATTLALVVIAHIMRMTRASILDVLSHTFIEMVFLKGVPTWRVVAQHALPNALAPIINVVLINLAYLIVGIVVVEVVFVYPGMGQYMIDAVVSRDMPVIQACGLVFATTYVALNLLADVLSILANPRLRHPK